MKDHYPETISENFERLQYFNFETNFLKNKNLFKRPGYHFLVESFKNENASFPYKSVISEAIVKAKELI